MSGRFASGKRALAICDICGFTCKLRELRDIVVKGRDANLKACPECWDPDHPQLHLGELRIEDPQALRDPRPDSAELPAVRGFIVPVSPVVARGTVRSVFVAIS